MVADVKQQIACISLLVADYDEAVAFYCDKLAFKVLEDTDLGGGKRWVSIAPPGSTGTALLLAKASSPQQEAQIGLQAGGRVLLFLQTNDFWRDYHQMCANGINFLEAPREEVYATVVVFTDLYGNKWDLIQPKSLSS